MDLLKLLGLFLLSVTLLEPKAALAADGACHRNRETLQKICNRGSVSADQSTRVSIPESEADQWCSKVCYAGEYPCGSGCNPLGTSCSKFETTSCMSLAPRPLPDPSRIVMMSRP